LSTLDWKDFFETVSLIDPELAKDPAGVYSKMDFATRDRYRHVVEEIAKKSTTPERRVAEQAIELAMENIAARPADRIEQLSEQPINALVNDRFWLVTSLAQVGRFADAVPYESEAIRLAELTHHPYAVGMAHGGSAILSMIRGDWAKARSLLEPGLATIRNANIGLFLSEGVALSAWALAHLDEGKEALKLVLEGEQLVERLLTSGFVGLLGSTLHSLGRACLRLNRLDEARGLSERAITLSLHQPGFRAYVLHLLGDIASHPDRFDPDAGEAHYRQALALAEPRRMRPLVAHCHLGLGRLYRRTGKQN